ncbi:MAG: acyl-CoA dehydrogenase family protein [Rhodospirillaceae bacterium]|nr:acyl-CoA dehydrogenase family protein [Rhodospirillaceae bacterium]
MPATAASAVPTHDELVTAARGLVPLLKANANAAEDARDLPQSSIAALKKAGLHKIYMPRRYGGYEMDWGAHYAVSREVAQACGSTGWMVSLVFSHIMWAARFPAKAQDEFFASSPDPILGTGSAGGGLLTPTEGGYILNGRWGFVSGVNHAAGAMVVAKTEADKLFSHFVLMMPGEYTVENNWEAEGLRGTGSHHIKVVNQFIPAHRAVARDDLLGRDPPGSKLHASYVYKVRPALYQKSWFPGVVLGTALGGLQEYCAQTKSRTGQLFGEGIADQVPVQIRLGESMAEIDVAAQVFENYIRFLHEKGKAGEDIVGEDILRSRRTVTTVARMCLSAIERLSAMMGVTAQSGRNPVQRLFRDCRTVSTHIELNWDHSMAPSGKYLLGLKTGDPMVDAPADGPLKGAASRAILGTQV